MRAWYHAGHQCSVDLPDLARIIQAQKPGSLSWASGRLTALRQRLALQHDLLPVESRNGFDWTGRYEVDGNNLAFFDEIYGGYNEPQTSLRLTLQLCADPGKPPETFIWVDFNVTEKDGNDEWDICHLLLDGMFGRSWKLRATFHKMDGPSGQKLRECIPEYYTRDVDEKMGQYTDTVYAEDFFELFNSMATYLTKHGTPSPS